MIRAKFLLSEVHYLADGKHQRLVFTPEIAEAEGEFDPAVAQGPLVFTVDRESIGRRFELGTSYHFDTSPAPAVTDPE